MNTRRLLTTLVTGLSMFSPFSLILSSVIWAQVARADDKPRPSYSSVQPNVSITPRVRPGKEIGGPEADREATIRVDTTLVLIPVGVTDPIGRIVTGLERHHFKVTEDKVEQELVSVSSEDVALSVGIVFDTSGSMGDKLKKAGQAVTQFMKLANPEDEFFLVQFNDSPELTVPFTRNVGELQSRLMFLQSKGRTALLDAVYLAIHEMKRNARNPRKAILIVSDGGDNSSRYSQPEVQRLVREADVQIYAIGIFEPFRGHGSFVEELNGPGLLGEIAEQSGGRHFIVDNVAELPDIATKIGLEIRNQYLLSYTPKNAVRDGKYRKVEVRLVKLQGLLTLRPTFRRGYYAPPQ